MVAFNNQIKDQGGLAGMREVVRVVALIEGDRLV